MKPVFHRFYINMREQEEMLQPSQVSFNPDHETTGFALLWLGSCGLARRRSDARMIGNVPWILCFSLGHLRRLSPIRFSRSGVAKEQRSMTSSIRTLKGLNILPGKRRELQPVTLGVKSNYFQLMKNIIETTLQLERLQTAAMAPMLLWPQTSTVGQGGEGTKK